MQKHSHTITAREEKSLSSVGPMQRFCQSDGLLTRGETARTSHVTHYGSKGREGASLASSGIDKLIIYALDITPSSFTQ